MTQKTIRLDGKRYNGKQLRNLAIAKGEPTAGAAKAVRFEAEKYNEPEETPFELYVRLPRRRIALTFREYVPGNYFTPVCAPEKANIVDVYIDGAFGIGVCKTLWI